MTRPLATFVARLRPRLVRAGHLVRALAIVVLLAACEGSGQSGSAFVFLTVDGFSLSLNGTLVSSVPSATSQSSTTTACVTLRNNLKNPTFTSPNALDNVTIRSYTLLLNGRTFTFGTAILVPAGSVPEKATNVAGNTATFSVVVVPAGAKGAAGSSVLAEFTFRGRDGRGQEVEAEGAVAVLFQSGLESDSSCSGTAPAPAPTPTPTPTTP